MTYLTQINLDFETVARLHIRDAYDWHQRVWQCFPGCDGQQRDHLTRLDPKPAGFQLLIASPVETTRPDWCPRDCWRGPKRIPETYFSRDRYRFQLCANPTRKVAAENTDGSFKKNGRREPLRSREDLVAWIKRKGEQGGFAVDEDTLRTIRRGREYFTRNGQRGLHSAVEFQGILAVTDPTKFCETFRHGIGSAKAFGFGLLLIAPVSAP